MVKKYIAPPAITMRWGHNVQLKWIFGSEIIAPPANTSLITYSPTEQAYIYGFFIFSDEPNDFLIQWDSNGTTYEFLIATGARGTTYYTDIIPINEGYPADKNSTIRIINIKPGSPNTRYRVAIFIGEMF